MSELRIGWWTRLTDFFWFCRHYWSLRWPFRDALHALAATFAGEGFPENGVWKYQTWIESTGCYCGTATVVDEQGKPVLPATANGTTNTHTFEVTL